MTAKKNLSRFLETDLKVKNGVAEMETDVEEIRRSILFTEKMFPNCILMLCSRRHKTFGYISESCKSIVGYSPNEFQSIMKDDFFQIIHPDDMSGVASCLNHIVESMGMFSDLSKVRFVLHYRMKHGNGKYIHVSDEKIIVESHTGKHIAMTLLTDVSATSGFSVVKMEVLVQNDHRFGKITEFIPAYKTGIVSSRELEVINLMKEGFNSKEIADRLSLSVNTIKNHRKSLFRKLNVRNSIELVRQVADIKRTWT